MVIADVVVVVLGDGCLCVDVCGDGNFDDPRTATGAPGTPVAVPHPPLFLWKLYIALLKSSCLTCSRHFHKNTQTHTRRHAAQCLAVYRTL
jgi:hypothetical protein